jgi:AraC family transcriptional regulator
MKILIKNMVCHRCITAVNEVFTKAELKPISVELGQVILSDSPSEKQMQFLEVELSKLGFEKLNDKNLEIIETIKRLIITKIHHETSLPTTNWSDFLSENSKKDYQTLSRLFSSVEGQTIEQYIIKQRIEKVKEYISYDQLSLSEIAFHLGYSSVAHLSGQFKKITGMTTSEFKTIGNRKPLDSL